MFDLKINAQASFIYVMSLYKSPILI